LTPRRSLVQFQYRPSHPGARTAARAQSKRFVWRPAALRTSVSEGRMPETAHRFAKTGAAPSVADLEHLGQGWLLDGEIRQLSPRTLEARRFLVERDIPHSGAATAHRPRGPDTAFHPGSGQRAARRSRHLRRDEAIHRFRRSPLAQFHPAAEAEVAARIRRLAPAPCRPRPESVS
jgi:hypothetical protein